MGVGCTGVSVRTGNSVGMDVASPISGRDSAMGVARAPDGVSIPSVPQAERRGIRTRIKIREVNLSLVMDDPSSFCECMFAEWFPNP
jgi:hypothetical protein